MLADDFFRGTDIKKTSIYVSLWMRNCPHVPLLEANTFIVSPLCVCWLPAHSQRLGKLNKDINGSKSIQRMLLTFVDESQW